MAAAADQTNDTSPPRPHAMRGRGAGQSPVASRFSPHRSRATRPSSSSHRMPPGGIAGPPRHGEARPPPFCDAVGGRITGRTDGLIRRLLTYVCPLQASAALRTRTRGCRGVFVVLRLYSLPLRVRNTDCGGRQSASTRPKYAQCATGHRRVYADAVYNSVCPLSEYRCCDVGQCPVPHVPSPGISERTRIISVNTPATPTLDRRGPAIK